ncbi:uncharacterized protein LOC108735943 [Agrilus planipennis]|uniref:Uncharacterized protein LOC108735943 n=1 Tax=Agrilus planipennis TaxID=224129 RepID=A0A7F5RKI5_AGRPL|nr:uncharacterized protein LOC108735943 [Agrilus planipennis]
MWPAMFALPVFLCVILVVTVLRVECRTLISDRQTPKGCEWQMQRIEESDDKEEPVLVCQIRTINAADGLLANLTQNQADRITALRLECSDVFFFESTLERSKYSSNFLSHLRRLRDLRIEFCKIRNIPSSVFTSLRELRRFSLRSHNSDWSAMTLELHSESFRNLGELRSLDLADNNIWTTPSDLFCPMYNLKRLNLTKNKIQDVASLEFSDWGKGPLAPGHACINGLEILDLSDNAVISIPDNSLTGLRALEELHLQENAISTLGDRAFVGLSGLHTLNLSSNAIVALPPELFQSSRDIRHLYIRNNSLSVLAPGLLEGLDQLQVLDLSMNDLSSRWVNRDTFSGLVRLVVLNLAFNSLTRIDSNVFHDLYSLQILNLENNKIDFIAEGAFSELKNLHALTLSHNNLVEIDAHHFSGMYALHQLLLDSNKIESIHPDAFENVTNLQDIGLNGNALGGVPQGLGRLRFLRTLDLGKNRIESVTNSSFEGLDLLYGLRLVDNLIVNISRDTFSSLPSLTVLNLASNRIKYVEQSAFASNTALKAIRLDSNELTDISGVFTNLQTLVWLNVSSNKLMWFDYSHLPTSLEWLDMHENEINELGNYYDVRNTLKIKMLDVSFNLISEINENSIPDSVETLFINNNRIATVHPGTFYKKLSLEKVVLYGNNIKNLDLAALSLTPVNNDRDLPQFYIGGNPFYCDCSMEWLLRITRLSVLRQYPQVLDLDDVMCELSHSRGAQPQPLLEMKPNQFLCPYESHCFALCHCCDYDACDCEMTCPDNCTCYHDHTWSSNVVDCGNAGYTHVPERIPMDATEIYLDGNDLGELDSHVFIGKKKLEVLFLNNSNIKALHNRTFNGVKSLRVLHMEDNHLKELRGFEFDQLEKIQELYLDHNEIAYVGNKTFKNMHKLDVLKLNDNKIVDFSPWKQLPETSDSGPAPRVVLDGNKWSCKCAQLGKLDAWIRSVDSDLSKLMCADSDGETLADAARRCETTENVIATSIVQRELLPSNSLLGGSFAPLLAATLASVIVLCLLVALVFVCRQNVRLWVHSKYGIRIFQEGVPDDPNDDKDRLYDCYMVYSHKDDDIIARTIASELEQLGYTMCLHYRDLHLLGNTSYLTDAMVGAADASRRCALVLSPNFICNEWARGDFKAAIQSALRTADRRKLICVLYGPSEPMDPELRSLLRACMVTRWGERRFWEKLRYAMPDIMNNKSSRGKKGSDVRCKPNARYTPAPTATDSWYKYHSMPPGVHGNHLTPTPTQSTYVSGESARSTEDEGSSAGSQHYGSEQLNHSYVSIDGRPPQYSQYPQYKEPHHVYHTIPDNNQSQQRTYFVKLLFCDITIFLKTLYKMWPAMFALPVFLCVILVVTVLRVECRTLISDRQTPKGCEWQMQRIEESDDKEEPVLVCQIRTINAADGLLANLTQNQADRITALRLECSDVFFFESTLERSKYSSNFLSHLRRLRDLRIEFCKIRNIPSSVFTSLRELRRFSLRSHNSDWSAMTLELHSESFRNLGELRSLDLADNNIWTTPSDLFCPMYNLKRLNLTKNKIQDVASLEFSDWGKGPLAPGHACINGLEILDLSDNAVISIPDNSLTGLRALEELHLQENAISTLGDRAFVGLSGLHTLNLSSNAIVALPPELFQSSRDIRHLYIRNNSLSVLAPGLLEGLDQLQVLDLSMNDLSSRWVNRDTFSGLVRLVVLNLAFNSLTRIDSNVFHDLYSLQILNLENNKIDFIAEGAFSELKNLHALTLSHNNLVEIDAHHFSGMYALHQLLLDSNKIESIHPDAFENVTNLQDIGLNGNALGGVPQGLGRLRFLRTLDLGKNRIESVTNSSFEGLDLLYGLRLVDNLIVNISRDTFSSLPSLTVLNLASNRIKYVEQSAFASNTALKAIRLDSNELTDISGVFTNLQTLVWLNVSSNKLMWFDYSHLPTSLEWLDMHENEINELGNYYDVRNTLKIKMLDVSFNLISEINENSIPDSVETLFINNNRIATVHPGTFYKKLSLEKVVLYGNNIKNLDLAALSLTPVNNDRDLPQFYIGGNPFYCDCSMEWLLRITRLSVLRQYPQVLDLDDVMCELSHSRGAQPQPLLEMKPNQFLCPYESHCFALCHCCDYDACDCEMTCPDNCTCYHDHTWSSNVVDCGNAGYTHVPERIPMDATEIYLDGNDLGELDSHVFIGKKKLEVLFLNNSNIKALHNRTFNGVKSLRVLHMEDNHLKELRGFEFDQLEKIQELYLDHNEIAYVGNKTFKNMHKLDVLKLNDNKIVDFSPWKQLPETSDSGPAPRVVLDGNKWSCKCAQLGKLDAWIRSVDSDLSKLMCADSDGETLADAARRCETTENVIATSIVQRELLPSNSLLGGSFAPLLAATLASVIVLCLLVALVFVCRQNVRLWVHSKYGIRIFQEGVPDDPNDDKDRLYDCYMVYSHKDDDIIARTIASELEQLGYTMCLHYRDLHLLGNTSYLTDAMVGAADASRRCALVLSPNFICNEWARGDFKAAIQSALRTADRRKLICVLYGPSEPMDPELRSLLRACMVTRWGERRFWEKLRYAMPDIMNNKSSRGKKGSDVRCKPNARYTPAPTATDSWYKYHSMPPGVHGNHLTPTPTQSTYVSGESARSTEDEGSSAGSQHYGSEQLNHSYVSIDGRPPQYSQYPQYKEPHHVYHTIPDNNQSQQRTYFV